MVLSSPHPDVPVSDVPLHSKVLGALLNHMDRQPDKVALISAEDPSIRITYKEIYAQSLSVASFLAKIGLGHGDVLCQVLPNCIQYVTCYLASLSVGGAMSGASAMFTDYELERQFTDSACKVVLTDEPHLAKVLKSIKNCPLVKAVICVRRGGSAPLPTGVYDWDDVIKTNVTAIPRYHGSADDLALLPYSSGTTGSPKGVMLTHRNFGTMIDILNEQFDRVLAPKLQSSGDIQWRKEHVLLMLPFYHIYGFGVINQCLVKGMTGIILEKFDPMVFFKSIELYKVRLLMVVPPIVLLLCKHPAALKFNLSSIKIVITGAAPLGKEMCEEFYSKYKEVSYLAQAYGMTECGMASHFSSFDRRDNFLTVGHVLPSFKQKIIDPVSGKELAVGERGEICVRGPTIMKGYLNRPEATAETVDKEGWLHTGDIGYYNEQGETFIVDRLKELIKVKGLQVPPAELEDLLLGHSEIHDAAVIGIPDVKTGEKPKAFVVRANERLTEQDVQVFVQGKVSSYKWLTGGVEFVKEIPKSPSGKILRRFLRDSQAKAKI